ncbi:MAG: hypothetical protein U9P14_00960 [Gemmatimonadota bacterium]|nr:hypothetical protein [Gemmatimonadota bacterium]
MRQWLGEALKPVAQWCFDLVMAVPMIWVRVIFISILVVVGIWVLTLKPQVPETGAEEGKTGKAPFYKDLRWMALGVLVLQVFCYLYF